MRLANEVVRSGAISVLLMVSGCKQSAPAVSTSEAPLYEVRTFGALKTIMHEGQIGPVFRVGDANDEPHAFALGALSGLRGEVTILDGDIWLAYPDGARARVLRESETSEQATLFVVSHVRDWRAVNVRARVRFDQLDAFIEERAIEAGIDVSKPFPVRIEGLAAFVRWHVVDGTRLLEDAGSHEDHVRTAVAGRLDNITVQLVGFFGQSAQGLFTHMGHRTHFHVIEVSTNTMGHVDEVEIGEGARVLFPHRSAR